MRCDESNVDLEYNWHPIFLSQEAKCDSCDVVQKDDSFDMGSMFDEDERMCPSVAESLMVNQRMTEVEKKRDVELYKPIVEDISDAEINDGRHDIRYDFLLFKYFRGVTISGTIFYYLSIFVESRYEVRFFII